MFARFDENPAMTPQDIKETKRYGRKHARTHGQRENSIPTTNKVCGGYNKMLVFRAGIHKMLVKIANREDHDETASSEAA